MTDKLSLYNGALTRHIGETVTTLVENTPKRLALDQVWDNGALDTCLQSGQWDFAARTVKLDYSPSITPPFGYTYAFDRPTDLIRVMGVFSDEFCHQPLTDYLYEGAYWYANLEEIYVRFVSNDSQFGLDYSLWPPNFTRYVECYLAAESCIRITKDEKKRDMLDTRCERLLRKAKGTDAMENPSTLPPRGSWSRARNGRNNGERGKRNQLIG